MADRPESIRFGLFEANFREGELRKSGMKIKLQEKPLQILSILVERPGELVTREELQKRLWPSDVFVDFDNGLNTAINKLREALGDAADNPRFVETVPRRGYRFLVPVEAISAAAVGSARGTTATASPHLQVEAAEDQADRPRGKRRALAAIALLVAGLVVIAVLGVRQLLRSRLRPTPIRSLAVLPLENLSDDKGQDFFAEGMTEALTSELASIQELRVPSRTTVEIYKKKNMPLPKIAAELKVDAIVEGSVLLSGDRVGITVSLLDGRNDEHLWAGSYDRERRDVFALQHEVAAAIAQEVRVTLTSKHPAVNPESYEAYMRGRYHWNKRTEDELMRAIPHFQAAIAKDSKYALAYAGLSDTYGLLGTAGYGALHPVDAMPKAKDAALKALAINDNLAEAHASVAYVNGFYEWNWPAAEKEFQRAIAINPRYSTARQWYAEYLAAMGRPGDAMIQIKAAEETDPASLIIRTAVAEILYFQRDYDGVIAQCSKTLEREKTFPLAHFHAGRAYLQKQMYKEAIAEFQQVQVLFGHNPTSLMALGYALGRSGDLAGARDALAQLREVSQHRYVPAIYQAAVLVGLDRKSDALDLLDEAYKERSDYLVYLNVEPWADTLRSDPRFQRLVSRIGLPPVK